jgi:nucleotide-binding universal stress UspA family protein
MYQRILVPLDGSRISEVAVSVALQLRADGNSELLLVRMQGLGRELGYPVGFPVPSETLEAERLRCDTYLLELSARLAGPDDNIRHKVLAHHEDIAADLASTARLEKSQVIVMTSHGWEGLGRTLRGSVAEELARTAPCPVLIIGPHTDVLKEAKQVAGSGH